MHFLLDMRIGVRRHFAHCKNEFVVLVLALPVYGIPRVVHPAATVAGLATGMLALVLLGIAVGLAVPSDRAAQAIGLRAFFLLY